MGRFPLGEAGLFAVVGTAALGVGYLGTAAALRLHDGGVAARAIGFVAATYYAGAAAGALLCGPAMRRLGAVRTLAAAALVLLLSALGQIAAWDLPAWMVVRFLGGLGLTLLFGATECWLGARSALGAGGALVGWYVAVVQLGFLASHLSLAAVDVRSPAGLLFPPVALAFSLVLVLAAKLGGSAAPPPPPRLRAVRALRDSPVGVLGATWSGLVTGALLAMTPVLATEIGLAPRQLAALLASFVVGGIVLPVPLGRWSDVVDRRLVMAAAGLALAAASGLAIVLVESAPAWMSAPSAMIGGLAASIYPLAVAHTNDRLQEGEKGGASGLLLLAWALGSAVGPILAAIGMERLGPHGMFVFVGAASLGLSAVAAAFVVSTGVASVSRASYRN